MSELLTAAVGGAFAILVVIITRLLENRSVAHTTRKEYLSRLMNQLVEASSAYEIYLTKLHNLEADEGLEDHAAIIGKAIAACLAAGDAWIYPRVWRWILRKHLQQALVMPDNMSPSKKQSAEYKENAEKYRFWLTYIAIARLTRNYVGNKAAHKTWVEHEVWGHFRDRNRAALQDAIIRLAQMITET
jgi:hypothetical protein